MLTDYCKMLQMLSGCWDVLSGFTFPPFLFFLLLNCHTLAMNTVTEGSGKRAAWVLNVSNTTVTTRKLSFNIPEIGMGIVPVAL